MTRSLLDQRVVGPKEAAALTGVSESWIRRKMKLGGLPYSRIDGRVLIIVDKLMKWIESYEEDPAQEVERVLDAIGPRSAGSEL